MNSHPPFALFSRFRLSPRSILLLLTVFVLTICFGCEKKKEKASVVTPSTEFDLGSTLVSRIPDTAVAFVYHDITSPEAKWLFASSFPELESSGSDKKTTTISSTLSKVFGSGPPFQFSKSFLFALFSSLSDLSEDKREKFDALFKRVGIQPGNLDNQRQMFGPCVVYFTLVSDAKGPFDLTVGMLAKAASEANIGDKLVALKREIASAGVAVTDLSIPNGSGFRLPLSVILPDAFKSEGMDLYKGDKPLFVAWSGDYVAVSLLEEEHIASLLTDSRARTPKILNSAKFKRITQGLPATSSLPLIYYRDVSEWVEQGCRSAGTSPEFSRMCAEQRDSSGNSRLPFFHGCRAQLLTATAAETVTDFQFRYLANGDSPITQEVLKTLTPSTSQSIISAIPQNPLLVVSIDGTTVKGLVEKAVAPAEPWLESLISSLERVKRIAVSARIAPVGQSFLPVPDLLVVGETEAPEALTKSVTEVLTVALNKEGISAGMEWQDANINGIPVKAYRSPMGFGIFLTSQKNLFLAASTEAQLGASLDAIAGKGANVSSSLSPPTKETLITQPDIANFYLEFTQLASLIDNLSGMLTMFAPQGAGNGAAPFPPELSSQLRKMGTLTGTVSHQDELVTLKVSLHTVPGTS